MFTDFVLNGSGHGPVGQALEAMQFNPGMARPFRLPDGTRAVTINTGRTVMDNKTGRRVPEVRTVPIAHLMRQGIFNPVWNTTTLTKDEWLMLDQRVKTVFRNRLSAWRDAAAAATIRVNGMAKTIMEYQTVSDHGVALQDMDGLAEGRTDVPLYKLDGVPLPITHVDFWYSSRQLAISRGSDALDARGAEAAARRIAELLENLLIGNSTGMVYGTSTNYRQTSAIYGYKTFPYRLTKTNITAPTGSNPEVTVADVLAMRQQMYNNNIYGPFIVYHSTDWDLYLDNDYARAGGNNANMTLRDRLLAIRDIADVRRLDNLTDTFTMLMVDMSGQTLRIVNGMDLTTVQWESKGGMQQNFKVMTIQVPQFFADYNGKTGVLQGTTA